MNGRMISYTVGRILMIEAALLALPLLVAVIYGEVVDPYLSTMLMLVVVGFCMSPIKPKNTTLYARDGYAVVALTWLLMSAFGALPFVMSGDIPNFIDAYFETVSGFTTTGSSILRAVEPLSRSGLFWRSFTHWVGGMGVLVFVMAILPLTDARGMHALRAEMPGPTAGKLVSRMSDTAKILYGIYFVMTIILIALLMVGGMDWFDACVHAFGTAGTGGFSSRNASIGAYNSAYFDVVISVFMLLFGVNFNLYYFLLIGRIRETFGSEELRVYFGIVAAAVCIIAADIVHLYGSVATSVRHALFQVSTIITTTGYATADFDQWPTLSKAILVTLMFVGACAGSTGGGIKVVRIVTLFKASLCDMRRMVHPNAVISVRVEGKPLSDRAVRSVQVYLSVYVMVFTASLLLISLEGFDLVTTFTSVAACINNIGPGLAVVGPTGNFADFSVWGKLLLSFDMLVGRLEIFPMLLLFAPSIWSKPHIEWKNNV